jgi:hypothetical protein
MMPLLSRRRLLGYAGALATIALSGRRSLAAPKAHVESITVISKQPQYYHGWPTLTRRRDGQLLLVCSGGREAHVCPFGRVELMRSRDEGGTWTWPEVLLDSPIDDRDAGVVETAKGSLLVTTFTSLAFEPILEQAEGRKPGDPHAWPAEKLARWRAGRDRITAEQRQKELGVWMLRSTDGVRWSARYECQVNSPHGPIQLADGRLLYAGKELWKKPERVGVCVSDDDGKSWKWLAEIPTRPGDTAEEYHELHAVETADRRLIIHIRNHNKASHGEVLQSESSDGGKKWSEPRSTGVWGFPSHLLRLRDGRLLMTYGHRRKPLGNQARISEDHGRSWSEPLILSDDGASGDLGYPSSVQLDRDRFLTVWYEVLRGSPLAVLRQARWKLDA